MEQERKRRKEGSRKKTSTSDYEQKVQTKNSYVEILGGKERARRIKALLRKM